MCPPTCRVWSLQLSAMKPVLETYASSPILEEKQVAPLSQQFKANSSRKRSTSTFKKVRLFIQLPDFRH